MTNRVIVKFFKGHGPYNAGDIAGFEPDRAARLKGVARPYDAKSEAVAAEAVAAGDQAAVQKMIDEAEAAFAARTADLEAREAAVAEAEAATAGNAVPIGDADAETQERAKGSPPAQGGKKAAK